MNRDDKILFEQYFYGVGNKISISNSLFDHLLNLVLNSKEFNDSILKISDLPLNAVLISLYVKRQDVSGLKFAFSGMYYVTDGKLKENRTVYGDIHIRNGRIIVISNIYRYGNVNAIQSCELAEIFEINPLSECYYRFSSYSGMDYNETICLSSDDFEKAAKFKENTLKMIKSRKF